MLASSRSSSLEQYDERVIAYDREYKKWKSTHEDYLDRKEDYEHALVRYETRAAQLETRLIDVWLPPDDYRGTQIGYMHAGDFCKAIDADGRVYYDGGDWNDYIEAWWVPDSSRKVGKKNPGGAYWYPGPRVQRLVSLGRNRSSVATLFPVGDGPRST